MTGIGNALSTSTTTTNGIVAWDGTKLANYAGPKLSTGGVNTNSSQTSFFAFQSVNRSNLTGDGTTFQFVYDSVISQVGTGYDNTTGVFTAPVTGIYLFSVICVLSNITSGHVSGNLFLSSTVSNMQANLQFGNPFVMSTSGNLVLSSSFLVKLSVPAVPAASINIQLTVQGSTKTVGTVGGATGSSLRGILIG